MYFLSKYVKTYKNDPQNKKNDPKNNKNLLKCTRRTRRAPRGRAERAGPLYIYARRPLHRGKQCSTASCSMASTASCSMAIATATDSH